MHYLRRCVYQEHGTRRGPAICNQWGEFCCFLGALELVDDNVTSLMIVAHDLRKMAASP